MVDCLNEVTENELVTTAFPVHFFFFRIINFRRTFLERKVEGPSVLRLWPGLYFDSDTDNAVQDFEDKRGPKERVKVTMQVQYRIADTA